MIKFYQYKNCGTCKKAKKFLESHNIPVQEIDIVEHPPTAAELKLAARCYEQNIRKLFNTSGQLYRELDIKNKLPEMGHEEALKLLSKHGKLIKRPFLIKDCSQVIVGFNEEQWRQELV